MSLTRRFTAYGDGEKRLGARATRLERRGGSSAASVGSDDAGCGCGCGWSGVDDFGGRPRRDLPSSAAGGGVESLVGGILGVSVEGSATDDGGGRSGTGRRGGGAASDGRDPGDDGC